MKEDKVTEIETLLHLWDLKKGFQSIKIIFSM